MNDFAASLTGRLLRGMVIPMAGLAILLGVGGALVINEAVETVNDRILSAASRAVAESLAVEDGDLTLDLPASAFAMLEDAERDNVYYSISHANTLISGYADLPEVTPPPGKEGSVRFATASYRGHRVRIVAEVRRLPRINGLITVQVAETMDARVRVERRMLLFLALLEVMLIGLSAFMIPVAVRWGLSPMLGLRTEMDRRTASDFTPLPVNNVPIELRDFVSTFNGLLAKLEAAVQSIRRFTADASHQMRTPLSILRTHVAVIQQTMSESDGAQSSLSDIRHATERLQNLLVQLLALARADGATPSGRPAERINIVDVVRGVANDHAAQALERNSHLQFVSSSDEISISIHLTLVIELLGNILDNAIRYNDPGGVVLVEVTGSEGAVVVAVEDDGPGIPPPDRERVFERFTRLRPEMDRTGTGLGLSIVRSLADSVGAEVELQDARSGKGLRVEVSFRRT